MCLRNRSKIMELKIFMSVMFIFGAFGVFRGYKELKNHSIKSNTFDSFISLFMGIFEYSGIGRVLGGLLLMVIAIIFILKR
jgi:hypothetical protein